MNAARPLIVTDRLELLAPDPALAADTLAFFSRNRAHLAPWDPPTPEAFFSEDFQRQRLEVGAAAFGAGSAWRWWLRRRGEPGRLVGNLHFSQVARGPFQNALLGYSLDARCEGLGLMHEALAAAIAEVFSPALNLHRIQANVRPDNPRSLALLQRLGFEHEGLAREVLFIDGAWRDHVMTARRNPAFVGTPRA
jgi:ribosomal-protein-alanine N-acetyltransferase